MSEPSAESDVLRTLVAERRQAGMSMRAVARLTDVSPSCVHSWEHGIREPSLSNLRAWAAALGYRLTLTRVLPPDEPTVCIAHGRFIPCRKDGEHRYTFNPYWVKSVRDYQGSTDEALTWEPAWERVNPPGEPR